MTASRLRHRVALAAIVRGRDSLGGVTESLGDAVTVWAQIEPVDASQRFDLGALSVRPTHRVMIRWREGVDHRSRMTWRGRHYDVISVQDDTARREFLTLMVLAQEAGADD